MSDRRRWQLEGDLRQAFENYMGGSTLSGPWDSIIDTLAYAVDDAALSIEHAAKLHVALGRTRADGPDQCGVCDCPSPGMRHNTLHCPSCVEPHL